MSFRLISEVPHFDFFKPMKFWLAVSILGVLLTLLVLPIRGLNYGVDFLGGTLVLAEFPEHRDIGDYRAALSALDLGEPTVTEASGGSGGQVVLMRVGNPENAGDGAAPVADQVKAALDAQFPGVKYLQVDQVGGKVSDELVTTGMIAIVLSLLAIMIYVWLRFEWQFAVGAVVSLFHDVVVVVGIFSLFHCSST